jgi:hypothetical protein
MSLVIDQLSVDEKSVDELSVDGLSPHRLMFEGKTRVRIHNTSFSS